MSHNKLNFRRDIEMNDYINNYDVTRSSTKSVTFGTPKDNRTRR